MRTTLKAFDMKILLASQSPRRKELLAQLGFEFETVSVDCEEVFPPEMPVLEVAEYLSNLKAEAFGSLETDEVLITADTVVILDDQILGKPGDVQHAEEMLKNLAGKTHQVCTGITVKTSKETISASDVADVTFDHINDAECDYYISNFKPFDKAGGYGIQDWLGMAKISKIEGSLYTVMGLPTHLLYSILTDLQNSASR